MEEFQETDQPDPGLIEYIKSQVDNMPQWVKTHTELASETVATMRFSPVDALNRGLEAINRHKRGLAQLGVLGTLGAGVGVTAAALVPTHRR